MNEIVLAKALCLLLFGEYLPPPCDRVPGQMCLGPIDVAEMIVALFAL